jgi:hypothetical protein
LTLRPGPAWAMGIPPATPRSPGQGAAHDPGEIGARRLLYTHPAASIQLELCVLDTRPDHIAIAVRPDAPGLARWIDAFLQERSVLHAAEVLGRYEGPWTFRMGEPLRR